MVSGEFEYLFGAMTNSHIITTILLAITVLSSLHSVSISNISHDVLSAIKHGQHRGLTLTGEQKKDLRTAVDHITSVYRPVKFLVFVLLMLLVVVLVFAIIVLLSASSPYQDKTILFLHWVTHITLGMISLFFWNKIRRKKNEVLYYADSYLIPRR